MAIVEVTIAPLGTANTSLSAYVAECHEVVVGQTEVKYMLTPMSTILEGDLEAIMALIMRMHQVPFDAGAMRVSTSIKIDDRRDKAATMQGKLDAVTEKL